MIYNMIPQRAFEPSTAKSFWAIMFSANKISLLVGKKKKKPYNERTFNLFVLIRILKLMFDMSKLKESSKRWISVRGRTTPP